MVSRQNPGNRLLHYFFLAGAAGAAALAGAAAFAGAAAVLAGVVVSSAAAPLSALGMSIVATGIFSLLRTSIPSPSFRSLIRCDWPRAIGVVSRTILSIRFLGIVLIFTLRILLISLPPALMPWATPSKAIGISILIG